MANRWWPSASISATRSPARVPVSYPPWGLSDSPMPRWSTATTWNSRASAGISRRQAYQVSGQPCTSSSGGAAPPPPPRRGGGPGGGGPPGGGGGGAARGGGGRGGGAGGARGGGGGGG